MRSFSRGMLQLFWLLGSIFLIHACGHEQKKRVAHSAKIEIDCEEGENSGCLAASGPEEEIFISKSEEISQPIPVAPMCVFQEEALQQDIAYYDMQEIRSLLLQGIGQDGLTQENAVQFALVNNPELFAYYENLEIGNAGLIEAGLRQNPVISTSTRFADEPGKKINRTYDTAISFLDYFLIPLRERAALADLHVIEAEVEEKVLDLVRDVQINWLDASIAELKLGKKSELVELRKLGFELAQLQHQAGNISALKTRERELEWQLAEEVLKGSIAEAEVAREKLGRSLGLFGNETCFVLKKEINWTRDPMLPPLAIMEEAAMANRPDIEALRREIDSIAQEAKLKEWWTYSNLKVGVSKEREAEGYTFAGPTIELEVPVFNYGQGERVKYDAMLAQTQKKLLAQAIKAASEVREFFKTANIYRNQLENLHTNVLPNFSRQIESAMSHYNVMTLGVFDLFHLKEEEIETTIEQLDALKNYEQANIKLFHATGGSLAPRRSRE